MQSKGIWKQDPEGKYLGPQWNKMGGGGEIYNRNFIVSIVHLVRMIKSRRLRLEEHVARMEEGRAYWITSSLKDISTCWHNSINTTHVEMVNDIDRGLNFQLTICTITDPIGGSPLPYGHHSAWASSKDNRKNEKRHWNKGKPKFVHTKVLSYIRSTDLNFTYE